ncbi:Ig-like domain-containing protein [uncultured Methanobrevibacter sp.]|uniref:Ig-like domain-containing protein n=1 Tax=uncultured Methanobrevibacter sp. TaxID=253161 RepID=UPI002613E6B2|nr:Ig-like domain repeat protein [uncultured Methanobrevibacter sp.]
MEKNKIIIVALIVIIVALIIGLVAVMPNYGKEKSNLTIKNNDTITQGESINVELTAVNGTPIENETVNITITDENGTTDYKSAVTDEKGVAEVKIEEEDAGNYTVNCTFEGNDNFTEETISETVEIVEEVSEDVSTSEDVDPGAFYSAQEGRIIYTGEIHDAPDGHKYKHLGNNEWEMVE